MGIRVARHALFIERMGQAFDGRSVLGNQGEKPENRQRCSAQACCAVDIGAMPLAKQTRECGHDAGQLAAHVGEIEVPDRPPIQRQFHGCASHTELIVVDGPTGAIRLTGPRASGYLPLMFRA